MTKKITLLLKKFVVDVFYNNEPKTFIKRNFEVDSSDSVTHLFNYIVFTIDKFEFDFIEIINIDYDNDISIPLHYYLLKNYDYKKPIHMINNK